MAEYRNYGRVGCFKGFDAASFSFNTRAEPELFEQQFTLMAGLLKLGLDVYAYATFTTPPQPVEYVRDAMRRFVDRLQALDEHLPLRTVPLEIQVFTPVEPRIGVPEKDAFAGQVIAIEVWQDELAQRYSAEQRERNVADIPLRQ